MFESKISKSKDVPLWHKILCAFVSLCLVVSLNPHLALALDGVSDEANAGGSAAEVTQNDQSATESSNNEPTEAGTPQASESEASQETAGNVDDSSEAVQLSGDSVNEANSSNPSVSLQDDAVTIKTSIPVKPGETTSTQYYAVGDKISTYTTDSSKNEITADKLTYQWKSCATKSGTYTDIEGATNQILDIDASLQGKYLRCLVSVKGGTSTYTASVRQPIAAEGSFAISSVTLDKSGELAIGDTITATATAASGDVSADSHVTWSWYYGSYSSAANTKIEGQTGRTLTITSDMGLNGKYIKATANGGLGDTSSSIIGPVNVPGAVELYKIEVAGSAKVGSKLTATAYKENSYTKISSGDSVTYQWQKSDTKSTSDSAFSDIAGANATTLDVTDDLVGKYIRVKATSNNSVVSTKMKSYYSETSVDPVGPVTIA
ncbi:MAG: hypothetical protein Q3982_02515, partial [Phoenicibacter congonensis]|nr:hypothetical protein [Phoenicibacter congonensis]